MLRGLFPKWEPTDEQLKEVWFKCFDKPDGLGRDQVSQLLLREAIVEARQVHSYKDPDFDRISRIYRTKRTESLIERDKIATKTETQIEMAALEREHKSRIQRIDRWSQPRKEAAIARAKHRVPSLRKQTEKDHHEWSSFCTGMVIAADEEIFLEK